MRLTTMLVLATVAVATFAPAASAATTVPPDRDQAGPDPSATQQFTFAGGRIARSRRTGARSPRAASGASAARRA